jgi:Tellurite resistance protein TerB
MDRLLHHFVSTAHEPEGDEAVIDLLALVTMADHTYGADEVDHLHAFVDGRDWPPAHNPQTYLLGAISRARAAVADEIKLDEMLDSIFERLAASPHRTFAIKAAEDLARSDGEIDNDEALIIDMVRTRLSILSAD